MFPQHFSFSQTFTRVSITRYKHGSCFLFLKYTAAKDIPGLLLFLDFERAFDTLELPFLYKTLRHFDFGPILINWIKVFYADIESCTLNNGWTSNFFQFSRDVRQGCFLSPYLFVLAVEIMAEAFRKNARVKGIVINGKEIKFSQYADDTTFVLNGSEESLKESLNLLDTFGKVSGLRLNRTKTEALWIDSKARSDLKLCRERHFKWPKERSRLLVYGSRQTQTQHCPKITMKNSKE